MNGMNGNKIRWLQLIGHRGHSSFVDSLYLVLSLDPACPPLTMDYCMIRDCTTGNPPVLGGKQRWATCSDGREKIYVLCSSGLHVLDTGRLVWSHLGDLSADGDLVRRQGYCIVYWNGDLIAFGGDYGFGTRVQHSVKRINVQTLTCTSMETQWISRSFHSVAQDRRMVYIFGGFTPKGEYMCDLYRFDCVSGFWECLHCGKGPVGRIGHSLTFCKDTLFLFGGTCKTSPKTGAGLYTFDLQKRVWIKQLFNLTVVPPRRVTGVSYGDEVLYCSGDGLFALEMETRKFPE